MKPEVVIVTFREAAERLFGKGTVPGATLAGADVFVIPGPYERRAAATPLLDELAAMVSPGVEGTRPTGVVRALTQAAALYVATVGRRSLGRAHAGEVADPRATIGPGRFSEIAARVNGVSTPIFGVSWTPPTVDVDVARRVVAFVETRRVLFSTYSNEVPEECVHSVLEIRGFLSDVIGAGGIADELVEPLRLMRRYCVRFLERIGATEDRRDPDARGRHLFRDRRWAMHDYWFGEALGELRAGVGLQIAIIAASFGLDVDDALASTLPAPAVRLALRSPREPNDPRVGRHCDSCGEADARGARSL